MYVTETLLALPVTHTTHHTLDREKQTEDGAGEERRRGRRDGKREKREGEKERVIFLLP